MKINKLILFSLLYTCFSFAQPLRVMIIDTGLDFDNPELTKYVAPGLLNPHFIKKHGDNPEYSGHGTHITGIITTAKCKNYVIYPCKYTTGYSSNIESELVCVKKAILQDIDIINFSSGGEDSSYKEKKLINKFLKKGGVFIAAAGNNNENIDKNPYYPAAYDGVIAVGNLNLIGFKAPLSNWGYKVVWRRGENVISWLPGGKKGPMSGTSQAAAQFTADYIDKVCHKYEK